MPLLRQKAGDGDHKQAKHFPFLHGHGAHFSEVLLHHLVQMVLVGHMFFAGNDLVAHEDRKCAVQQNEGQVGNGVLSPGGHGNDRLDLVNGDEGHFRAGQKTIARRCGGAKAGHDDGRRNP